jgi:hypothetical protein
MVQAMGIRSRRGKSFAKPTSSIKDEALSPLNQSFLTENNWWQKQWGLMQSSKQERVSPMRLLWKKLLRSLSVSESSKCRSILGGKLSTKYLKRGGTVEEAPLI